MLKKLAKYGNSTTLVIDKAILELLNMDESSIVKLQTDGKSLIITPVVANNGKEKVSYENYEAMNAAKEAAIKKMPNVPVAKETFVDSQKDFSNIFEKYNVAFTKFTCEVMPSEQFQTELAKISEKFDPATHHAEYLQEFNKLKVQFCPQLADMDKEINEIHKKYAQITMPNSLPNNA